MIKQIFKGLRTEEELYQSSKNNKGLCIYKIPGSTPQCLLLKDCWQQNGAKLLSEATNKKDNFGLNGSTD